MAKYAKWIGGALGWAVLGPLGALFGFAAGSFVDAVNISQQQYRGNGTGVTQPGDFRLSLIALLTAVMKADKKNRKSELDFIKIVLSQSFGNTYTQQVLPVIRDLMQKEIPHREICQQIRTNMEYDSRIELVHILFKLAQVDNEVHVAEVNMIEDISGLLGIHQSDYASVKAMFFKDVTSSYRILGITPDVNDDEVKKAYRKMAAQYHPDKVAHLGKEVAASAEEKIKAVNQAYDEIRKQRNMP